MAMIAWGEPAGAGSPQAIIMIDAMSKCQFANASLKRKNFNSIAGCGAVVAHTPGGRGVAGSNPVSPTHEVSGSVPPWMAAGQTKKPKHDRKTPKYPNPQ
jgi:hypothetical protein